LQTQPSSQQDVSTTTLRLSLQDTPKMPIAEIFGAREATHDVPAHCSFVTIANIECFDLIPGDLRLRMASRCSSEVQTCNARTTNLLLSAQCCSFNRRHSPLHDAPWATHNARAPLASCPLIPLPLSSWTVGRPSHMVFHSRNGVIGKLSRAALLKP
jgi:hypothetical protein